MTESHSLLS